MAREADTKGYIKLHRKAQQTEVFKNPYAWQLFTYCLFNARFSGSEAGTFEITQKQIRDDLKWSKPTLIKFMKFLKEIDCIEYESVIGNTGKTVIRIVNFEKYQESQR